MKKLTIAFVAAALFTISGCSKKKGEEGAATGANTEEAQKPAEGAAEEAKPAEGTAPAEGAAAAPAEGEAAAPAEGEAAAAGDTAAAGDLPAECEEWKAAIEALEKCDKVPAEAKDAQKKAFDGASASWASLPAEAKAQAAEGCKAGAEGAKAAAAACN